MKRFSFILFLLVIIFTTTIIAQTIYSDNQIYNMSFDAVRGAIQTTSVGRRITTPQDGTYSTNQILNLSFDSTLGALQTVISEPIILNYLNLSSVSPYIKFDNISGVDGDGTRASYLQFKGRQSGNEVSTLAKIQASHDGTGDDQKGDLIFYNNRGSDGDSPTESIRIDSAGFVGINESDPATMIEVSSTTPYLTLHNSTDEDGDGGRESQIIFRGHQSGSEETVLAKIQASHDGTGDTQKGELIFFANDTNDGSSPSEMLRMNHTGIDVTFESAEGVLALTTNEGTNTTMDLRLAGKGSGDGKLSLYADGFPGALRGGLQLTSNLLDLSASNSGPVNLQKNGNFNIEAFADAASGETPTFGITGFKTGDASRTLLISVDDTVNNQAVFEGISTIAFDADLVLKAYTRSITIPANAATLGPNAPGAVTIGTYRGLGFDNDNETVNLTFEVPDDWDGLSDMELKIYWSNDPGDALANTETVKWDFTYRVTAEGDDLDAGTQGSGTKTYTQSGAGTDGEFFETEITIAYDESNQPLVIDSVVGILLDRDMGGDTYTGDGVVIQWEIDYTSVGIPTHD